MASGRAGWHRTKIVATVGPACRDPAMLRRLIAAGVDMFRLNFSHASHAEHSTTLAAVRAEAEAVGHPVAVLQDLCGPKIRLGPIPGDLVDCPLGAAFRLDVERAGDDPTELTCTYRDLPRDLKVGDSLLFADGTVAMRVTATDDRGAALDVTLPGRLRSGQGVNAPGAALSVAALTPKDRADLDWTATHEVDYVGLSFVRSAADVEELRAELESRSIAARIVAKIEKPQALDDLEAIVRATDAVMVARGDLGVELDVAKVPAAQKRIIAACNRGRVPVITATQMLNSMETSSRPTRAEASDVFNAVLDGTDALMLSGETAVGDYPVEAVTVMGQIAAEAEALLAASQAPTPPPGPDGWIGPVTEAVVEAASLAARRLGAALIVVATHSGRTALALSKHRNPTPTLALADSPAVARRLALYWGVTPRSVAVVADPERSLAEALAWARARGLAAPGDRVVLVRGTVPGDPSQNAMLVQEIPAEGP